MIGITNALLGPLANNGGPTKTHALLPGSPAIDAGDPAAVAGVNGVPEFDQRGVPWSRVVGGRIDMGAIESQANPLAGDYNFNGVVDAADYSVWMDTLGSTIDLRADGRAENAGVPDGVVDEHDYAWWKAKFGNVYEQGAGGREQGESLAVVGALAASQRLAGDENAAAIGSSVRPQGVASWDTAGQASSGTRRAVRSRLFAHTVAAESRRDLLIAALRGGRSAWRWRLTRALRSLARRGRGGMAAVDEVFREWVRRRGRLS